MTYLEKLQTMSVHEVQEFFKRFANGTCVARKLSIGLGGSSILLTPWCDEQENCDKCVEALLSREVKEI